ncbi:MAG: DUF655 domain-containing protein [Nanoarchaeota archaeon]|nr:DUF655 domain-containing protein [Nanoarchaeota archaeon]
MLQKQFIKEDEAVILDFLPNGYPMDVRPMHLRSAIAQALGKQHFILLELVPKKGVFLQPNEEVYMGEGKRDKIHHILGKIPLSKLTETAKNTLEHCLHGLVQKDEALFVEFFNKAAPVNTRFHQIELLPGIGKKHMWEILEARENAPFKSFADIKERVKLIPDPEKSVVKRILQELEGSEKHMLFVGR